MKNLIIEVPFGYGLTGKTKGQRNPRDHLRESSVRVKIACPSDDEAPVALIWHRRNRWAREGMPDRHPDRHLRSFDGRLFVEIENNPGSGYTATQLTAVSFGAAVAGHENWETNPLSAGAMTSWHDYREKVQVATDLGDRLIVETSEETKVASEIARKAQDLIIVDGRVYRSASEPVYVVGQKRQGNFENPIGAELTFLHSIEGPLDIGTHFRADQLDEALQVISGRMRRLDFDFDAEDPEGFRESVPDWIEVRDPSVLTLRLDQGPKLIAAAQERIDYYLDARFSRSLGKEPLEFLVAYAHLRDALDAKAPAETIAELSLALIEVDKDSFGSGRLREEIDKFRMAPVVEAPAPAFGPRA